MDEVTYVLFFRFVSFSYTHLGLLIGALRFCMFATQICIVQICDSPVISDTGPSSWQLVTIIGYIEKNFSVLLCAVPDLIESYEGTTNTTKACS